MTFREFWPHYLRAHRQPRTRVAHYVATIIAFSAIAAAIYYQMPLIALGAIAVSYAIALASHAIFERNHSLVFVNPAWGALSDLKMCWLALTGGLAAELTLHVGSTTEPREMGEYFSGEHFSPDGDSLRRLAAARRQP
jgi:hypothetical protein